MEFFDCRKIPLHHQRVSEAGDILTASKPKQYPPIIAVGAFTCLVISGQGIYEAATFANKNILYFGNWL